MENVLPKGWESIKLKESVDFRKGKKPKILSDICFEGAVPYMDIQALEKNIIGFYADPISAKYFKKNDVVIVWDGSRSGLILKPKDGAIGSTLGALCPYGYNSEYLYYFLLSHYETINSKARGVGIPHVDPTYLWGLKVPLPPLAEQERIVAKLDALFAQHEVMKKALERIPQLLKNFRQQVLTQAVTGKLTEQWREEKDLEKWKEFMIKDISDTRLGKMLDKAKNSGNEYPYLGNIDVQWNKINTDNLKNIKIDDIEFEKFKLEKGDVLVCEGGEAGRAAIWKNEGTNIIFQKALHRVRLYPGFLAEILLYNLELDTKSGKISNLYTGTTIKHLTGQNFAKYIVRYCSLQEQQEIVSRVESLFAKADAIETRYKNLKAKIESLPQALLHKAFKGELVTQMPTDGDSKDLLAEIIKLKEEAKPKGKKK